MADSGEIDLRGFVRMLNRRKGLLLLSMAVTLTGTLIWVFQVTPQYTADALIAIEPRPSSIVRVNEAAQDLSADSAKVNTEVAILESRSLADRVIFSQKLSTDPEFTSKQQRDAPWAKLRPTVLWDSLSQAWERGLSFAQSGRWSDKPSLAAFPEPTTGDAPWSEGEEGAAGPPAPEFEHLVISEIELETERAALIKEFLRHLTVTPIDASRLIQISFRSTDPAKAARIANEIVDEYIASQLETKSEGARRAAEWLDIRLHELGGAVQSLEQEVQMRRAESGSNAIGMVAKTLEQLNSELVSAQAAAAAVTARYDQAQTTLKGGGNLDALPSVISSASIQALRARYTELAGKLSDLQTTYGTQHPIMVSIRAEMTDLKAQHKVEVDNILAGLRNEVKSATIREKRLRDEVNSVSAEMVRLTEAEASIEQVAQRLQASRDLYQNLLKRHTETVALRDNQQPDARVISPAQISLSPSFPKLPQVLILAFIGSASLSTLLLFLVERFRQKLDTIEDAERYIGLPAIGAIPDLPRLCRMRSSPRDYIQREPLSEVGSAFQRLRALLVLGNYGKMPRRVLVTSAAAKEGKTTAAVCLGVACVASGDRVLLVDCDFGRPRLHEMMGVENDKGLTDVLKGTVTLDDAMAHASGMSLSILTIGRSREGAIDLLNYGRMGDLLAQIKDGYDTVILDSAPVLEVSNALILGGLVERTVLVARRNWTSRRKISEAARMLQLYGADVAGLVFNRAGSGDT